MYLQDYFYLMLFLFMLAGLGILLSHSVTFRRWQWRFALPRLFWRRSILPLQGQQAGKGKSG